MKMRMAMMGMYTSMIMNVYKEPSTSGMERSRMAATGITPSRYLLITCVKSFFFSVCFQNFFRDRASHAVQTI